MFSVIKNRLEKLLVVEKSDSQTDVVQATSFAATALLLEAAQADNKIDEEELRQIEQSLVSHLGISPDSIEQTIRLAQNELDHATCLYEITKLINDNWKYEEKINLIEAMWKVVLSDQRLDPHEQHLMRKVKGLLHIPQSEYIAAKLRARNALDE